MSLIRQNKFTLLDLDMREARKTMIQDILFDDLEKKSGKKNSLKSFSTNSLSFFAFS